MHDIAKIWFQKVFCLMDMESKAPSKKRKREASKKHEKTRETNFNLQKDMRNNKEPTPPPNELIPQLLR